VVNERLESGRGSGLLQDHLLPAQEKKKTLGSVGALPAAMNAQPESRLKPGQPKEKQEDQKWRARKNSIRRHGNAAPEGGAHSADFPDSTRGTALLSPPDSGTASPLDWSPGMTHGFPDFAAQQFLNPSFRAARRAPRKRTEAARQKTPSTNNQLRRYLNLPSLSTSMNNGLQTRMPDPLDELNSQ
jgi:hypothetical protein